MKRALVIVFVTLVLGGVVAAPVAADRPITFVDTVTFDDIDPCTGLQHEVTLVFDVRLHLKDDRVVVTIQRSGVTDSGYEMVAGAGSFIDNGNRVKETFMDQWRGPDGAKFRVNGTFVIDVDTGEALVERFALTCIGAT